MPLHVPSAPVSASRSVLAALRSQPPAHRGRAPGTADGAGCALEIELPLPVHELTGDGPDATGSSTRLTGWRFLLRDADAPAGSPAVGAAETLLTSGGWAFAYFCGGPYVASSQRALRQAESLPGLHQPRLLSVPRLYMLTLWLHGTADADITEGTPQPSDLLIPLAPAPPGIAAHVPHRAETLLPLLTRRSATRTPLLNSRA
ncbi:hypothetical protein DB35_00300 [Streptomyces abyssalis]|uniref:Uncharacterized protein n=1 Tax=Streptomyces abyssalis TaxID=933944 RepID=A0A1E7JVE7_9ACTN|nr:hypothetical protein [Streptomyces abyssalis]OEU94431.1 hypothetical protein AN215_00280 [Streptomyces abyssalis]OEU95810.1 hypothetical protein DB35_00300 [Streptomyces abyssalis]OEV31401.1 hypothetical protein AN219_05285 [Streptomyces nanshensis]